MDLDSVEEVTTQLHKIFYQRYTQNIFYGTFRIYSCKNKQADTKSKVAVGCNKCLIEFIKYA